MLDLESQSIDSKLRLIIICQVIQNFLKQDGFIAVVNFIFKIIVNII